LFALPFAAIREHEIVTTGTDREHPPGLIHSFPSLTRHPIFALMLNRVFPPGFILPAQPVKRQGPPCGPSWVHEIKHDGYRLIVLKGATVRLFTYSGNDWTDRFPLITKAAQKIRGSFLIDGEARRVQDNLSEQGALAAAIRPYPWLYAAFPAAPRRAGT